MRNDSSTLWVSQYHGSKKTNNIDASQVKDNDFVICKGTYSKDGVLHATPDFQAALALELSFAAGGGKPDGLAARFFLC